jgi:HAMP domain-containing protein/predicted Ser/Thr protein kinase
MGLTQKILAFVSALVVALVAITLAFTTFQADRLARNAIREALSETKSVWETFQQDRYNKLKLGIRVLGNDPYFKAYIETRDEASVLDQLQERNRELKADFFIATDPEGIVVARSDRPQAQGEDLSQDPLVMKPIEGQESATVWREGERLFHAVSVPMLTGPDLKGVLIASYAINEQLASDIRKLTHSEIAYLTRAKGQAPQLSVSTLTAREADFKAALDEPSFAADAGGEPFELDLGGDEHVAVVVPLKAATGETVGSVVALRSLATELASFRQFRNGLVLVSLGVMAVALGIAYLAAARITGPVRLLVKLVEKARDGSYSRAVSVATSDEIGTLARAFNSLLTDLREKEQLIGFLREGMTMMKKGAGVTAPAPAGTTAISAAETTAMLAPTGVRIEKGALFAGRYEIQGTLGKGGMGVVYRAHDRQLDEVVALKVLRPEIVKDDPTILERFKAETKLARKISHRNILRTHDIGDAGGTPFISMEYVEGVTLKDLIANKGALPLGVGLRIAKQMCHGLEAAHQVGVVHRDIKPHNMLILPETGELKIMDFGIARANEVKGGQAGLTSDGTVMGTPDYMPPEQAQGKGSDFRSDIYSLGVVLFEMFGGRLPFSGDTIMSIVLAHIQTPPPRLKQFNRSLPVELEAIVLKCLEKDPARRFGSAGDLLKALSSVSEMGEGAAA